MTAGWLAPDSRFSRTIEMVFAVLFLALFSYSLADWLGWLPFERGFQPLRQVILTGALLLQAVASLVRRRSMLLYLFLIAAALLLLAAMFTVKR